MTTTLAVEDLALTLPELLDTLSPGDEVILTRNQKPLAKLIGEPAPKPSRPVPGLGRGSILHMSPDFDDSMDDLLEATE